MAILINLVKKNKGVIRVDLKKNHGRGGCSANNYPAAKKYPRPVTLPSVLSAVCIAQN